MQFDLYLPTGFKVKSSKFVKARVAYDEDAEEYSHSKANNAQEDGSERFVITSLSGAYILGESGAFMTITLTGDAAPVGTEEAQLKGCVVSTDTETISLDDVTFVLSTETGINTISADAQNGKVYDLQGRRVVNAQNGVYIQNGKKVLVK